jgi:hypothetical protein
MALNDEPVQRIFHNKSHLVLHVIGLERLRLFSCRLIWKLGSQKISPTEKIMAYFSPFDLEIRQPKDFSNRKNYGLFPAV